MQMLTTASKLDWSGWIRGVVGALISGGAGAIGGGFGAVLTDPSHDFTPGQGGTEHLLLLMGTAFIVSGIISLAKFLQTHPVPDISVQEALGAAASANIKAGDAISNAQDAASKTP